MGDIIKDFDKRRGLVKHLQNLKNAGISLGFTAVSRDRRSFQSKKGSIVVGMFGPRIVMISPEKPRKGIHLLCGYSESKTTHPHMGPRVVSIGPITDPRVSYLTLYNNIEYRILERHYSKVGSVGGRDERALKEGEVFDYNNLKI